MDAARYEAWHSHPRSPSYEVGHLQVQDDGTLQLALDPYDAPLRVVLVGFAPNGARRFDVFAPDGRGTVVLAGDGRSGVFDLNWMRGRLVRAGEACLEDAGAEVVLDRGQARCREAL